MFTKDRQFYRDFSSLFWVLVLQNVIVLAVNLLDNWMLANYDQGALSGAYMVNNIQFVVQNLIAGIGDAMVVLCSQYWGKREIGPIKRLSGIAMRIAMGFALLMFLLVSAFPHGILLRFSQNESYIGEGMKYLSIIRFSYPIFAVTSVLLATMRSVQTVRIAFGVSLVALVVNYCINYLLIAGRLGAPELGVTGAAIGTISARVIELVIVLIYAFRADKKLSLKPSDYKKTDGALMRDYLKTARPIMFVSGMWGVNLALQTMVLGHLTDDAMAANSVASNLMMLLKVASVGAAASAAVVIGKTVGMGDLRKVREYARTLQGVFLIIGVFTGLGILTLRWLMPSMFSGLSQGAKDLAYSFMLVMSVTATGMAYQMPTSTGIIRGGGDSRYCMIVDIISIWCIVLPVSFMAAFLWHWPPVAVVICLNADQVFKCIPAAIWCNRFKWIKQLTRA